MYNHVCLIGNVGQDSAVKHFDNGGSVLSFSIATSESYKDKQGEWQQVTQWHNIVASGKPEWTDAMAAKVVKGATVVVDGKVTYRKYTDKEGTDKFITEIKANSVKVMTKKESSHNDQSAGNAESNSTTATPSDDLPF